jgi:hypothetical protein
VAYVARPSPPSGPTANILAAPTSPAQVTRRPGSRWSGGRADGFRHGRLQGSTSRGITAHFAYRVTAISVFAYRVTVFSGFAYRVTAISVFAYRVTVFSGFAYRVTAISVFAYRVTAISGFAYRVTVFSGFAYRPWRGRPLHIR